MQSLKSFLNLIHFPTRNLQTIFHRSLHGIHHCFNPTSFLLMLQFLNYSIPTVTVSHSLLTIHDFHPPSHFSQLIIHRGLSTVDHGLFYRASCILYPVSCILNRGSCILQPISHFMDYTHSPPHTPPPDGRAYPNQGRSA